MNPTPAPTAQQSPTTPRTATDLKTICDFKDLLRQHLTTAQYRRVIKLTKFVLEDVRFWIAPASTSAPDRPAKHHGERGGLARHTWEVLAFVLATANAFPGQIDLVSLAVGAILHDCGKMDEYTPSFVDGVEYWNRTPLVSHIVHGLQRWAFEFGGTVNGRRKCPPQLFEKVTHLIASHHGRREWGSPVVPGTLEAFILHSADIQSLMLNGAGNPEGRS